MTPVFGGKRATWAHGLTVVAAVIVLAIAWGCGGGGSSGPADASAEAQRIVERLSAFMNTLGRGGSVREYISPQLAAATGDGAALASFTVYDFGSDIRNGTADDKAYTFFLQPSDIVFLSPDAAMVPSWIDFSNGTRFQLTIHVLRINGQWLIDDLEFKTIGFAYETGPVPSTALFPMAMGDRLNAVRLPLSTSTSGASPTADFVLTSIGGRSEINADGQEVFTLDRQEYSAPLPVNVTTLGAATDSLRFGSSPTTASRIQPSLIVRPQAAPLGKTLGEIAWLLDPSGLGRLRFSNTYGLLAFGADASFNQGRPWRLTNQIARDSDTLAQTVTFQDAGGALRTADLRTQFIGRIQVALPWGIQNGIRLDVQAGLPDTGEVIQESWMLVPGVGLVNVVFYDESTGRPNGQLCLLAAKVISQSFGNPAALPAAGVVLTLTVTAPPTSPVAEQMFRHSFPATGGRAPYTWSLSGAPSWLSIDAATGEVAGIPPAAGWVSFRVTVTDAGGTRTTRTVGWQVTPAIDSLAPSLVSFEPASGATGVALSAPLVLRFSEGVVATSVTERLSVTYGADIVQSLDAPIISSGGSILTYISSTPFAAGAQYRVTLAGGVLDNAGNALARETTWSFTTFNPEMPLAELLSAAPDPTNASPILMTASFSLPVTGFDQSDLIVVNGTIANFVSVLQDRTWTFEVTPTAQGLVQVNLPAGVATDSFGNGNLAAPSLSRTYDPVAPVAQLLSAAPDPTGMSPIPVTASFSETVSGFDQSDLVTVNGSIGNFATVTPGLLYTFDLTPIAVGNVTVTIPGGVASDAAGNGNLGPVTLGRTFSTPAPIAQLLSSAPEPTNLSSFQVIASFSLPVTGFDQSDLIVSNGSVSGFAEVTASQVWTFDVLPAAAGPVTIGLPAGVATDSVGNGNLAASSLSRTYDPVAPIAQLLSAAPDPFNTSSIVVTASFSEPVIGFDLSDLTPANGAVANLVQVTASQAWTFDLIASDPGIVQVTLAAGAAADPAGNVTLAASSLLRTFDPGVPALLLTTATNPTNLSMALVVASFSEPVTGFTLASVTVTNGSLGALSPLTASLSWQFEVLPSAHGEVLVQVATGAATDPAGNRSAPASLTFVYDIEGPVAAIFSTASEPTNLSSIPFIASFSEDLAGLTISDFIVSGGSLTSLIAASGTRQWELAVTPGGMGSVTVTLPAYQVYDLVGNGNPAAASDWRSWDGIPPDFVITESAGKFDVSQPVDISISSTEMVTGFTASDLYCSNATIQNFTELTPGWSWTARVVPVTAGIFQVSIFANRAFDNANNGNTAYPGLAWSYDNASPTSQLLTVAANPLTAATSFDVTASFSEDVTGFSEGSLQVSNAYVSGVLPVNAREYTAAIMPDLPGLLQVTLPASVAADASGRGNLAAPAPLAFTYAPGRSIDTLAGTDYLASASISGIGANARFITPYDTVVDGAGNRYVSDYDAHVIRKIDRTTGESTIFCGSGVPGNVVGASSTAQFNHPAGLAYDGTNFYVADSGNNIVRQIDANGTVYPYFAGGTLNNPTGLHFDLNSNTLYIADTGNHCIRSYNGTLNLFAGTSGSAGMTDGVTGAGKLSSPRNVYYDYANATLYVADTGNHAIRKVVGGTLTTLSGTGSRGFVDGSGPTSQYDTPTDVLYQGSWLWVADSGNHCIRQVNATTGDAATIGGTDAAGHPGWATGTSGVFRLNTPTGLAYSGIDANYVICDQGNHRVAGMGMSYDLFHIAGVIPFADGASARFNNPGGTAVDSDGNVYVADTDNHCIRMIDTGGNVTTVAGKPGQSGFLNNTPLTSLFFRPRGLIYNVTYADGPHLLVADTGNNVIRKVVLGANVQTAAGNPTLPAGYQEGPAGSARFNAPTDLASDSLGNLYVADSGNHVIRKLDLASSYQTSLFAGTAGTPGSADGSGAAAGFNFPTSLTIDASDTLFVADTGNGKVRKIDPTAFVTTVIDAPAAAATGIEAFPNRSGLLITASSTQTIRQLALDGSANVLLAGGGTGFYDNYVGTNATFRGPDAITVGANGYFYIVDRGNHAIRRGRHDAPMP